jgi:protein disulfide-isomerase A1
VHYFVATDAERQEYVSTMRPLAKKYQEYLNFVTTDVNEYPEVVHMLGHATAAARVLSVQNPTNGQVFPYWGNDGISVVVVEEFLVEIANGNVQPWDGTARGTTGHDEL